MPNSSGFVDFNQQLATSGDEERRLMEAAMSRAEAAQGKAQSGLQHASQQAGEQHVGLSETASYSDYLKARQDASNAWAAVTSPDANPRSVRGAIANRMGVAGQQQMAGDELQSREQTLGARNEGNAGAHAAYQRGMDERAAAAEAQRKAREGEDAANWGKYRDSLKAKMAGDWRAMDVNNDTFGFAPGKTFTIYGENMQPFGQIGGSLDRGSVEGNPDSMRLAQQARSAGLNDEADRYQSGATYEWGKRTKGGYG